MTLITTCTFRNVRTPFITGGCHCKGCLIKRLPAVWLLSQAWFAIGIAAGIAKIAPHMAHNYYKAKVLGEAFEP